MKKNNKKNAKTKKIVIIACVALVVLIIVGAILWLSREKENGIFTWFGTKMKADEILHMSYEEGTENYEFDIPFSYYRGVYLYYKNIISNHNFLQNTETGEITVTSEKDKNNVLKEVTQDNLVEYCALKFRAQKLGVDITDADRAEYKRQYENQIATYVAAIPEGAKYSGTKEQYARSLYEEALEVLGMTEDYVEYSFYKSLLNKRVKAAASTGIYDSINDVYYSYKQIYITFTMGDSESERKASEKITAALEKLDAGDDFDAVSVEYGTSNTGVATYFDTYSHIVGSTSHSSLGTTVTDMVKSLGFGEYSVIMSGEDNDTLGYYMIVKREEITTDFVCGDDYFATLMYQYPYYGSSSNSTIYDIYFNTLESYKQNISVTPVDENVYGRIAINTLY